MLKNHRQPVSLSLISTDLPISSVVETTGTLYQKDRDRFHLLLTEPALLSCDPAPQAATPRLVWLEISAYRVIMTMQGNGQLSYRHFWEKGVYGLSRYWLSSESLQGNEHIRLRNFTRSLHLSGDPLPEYLRLEYELWSQKVQLGNYVLSLKIQHSAVDISRN
ncbi:MAG: hypothetical protein H0X31_07135 [Nostocaceae cyanobacterium]|nr:hypothetical protein [Nostocaceae cyanobacterium]